MSLIRYIVRGSMHPSVLEEYLRWLEAGHVRAVVVRGGALSAEIIILDAGEDEKKGMEVVVESSYLFPSRAALEEYQVGPALELKAEGKALFIDTGKISFTRTTGRVALQKSAGDAQEEGILQALVKDWDLNEPENDIISGFWLPGDSLAPPCQSDMDVVTSILRFASPKPSDVLFDLGCGDGRICILASKLFGCKSVGCEIEDGLIDKFRVNIERTAAQDLVTMRHVDLRELDISTATIIVLYLLPESIAEIEPMLGGAIERGAVVICNSWGIKSLEPKQALDCGPHNNVKLLKYFL